MKLKKDVPGAILLREKPQECKSVCSRSSTSIFLILVFSYFSYSIKYQNWGVPEVICAQRPTTTCMSRHKSRWLLDLSPRSPANNPINSRALSMNPRLSLFSEVSYWDRRGNNKYQRGLEPTERVVNFQE